LLKDGHEVLGLDILNSYYDPRLKEARLDILKKSPSFEFVKADLTDRGAIATVFEKHCFPIVIHLAAQAGVRYSIDNPHAYADANLEGFLNVLEGCRHNECRHLLFASSSSVYGANTKLPLSVHDNVDHPISLYAATKKANELIAHSYSHLYRLPTTGLRFFTVYGPWGRPDMAMFIFAKAILSGDSLKLFNEGNMRRDFTFIDDVSEAVVRLMNRPPLGNPSWSGDHPDPSSSAAPWKIYNIGNSHPEKLMYVISLLEKEFGGVAKKDLMPMQPGDVAETYADTEDLLRDTGFQPKTTIESGITLFAKWYREYQSALS
jgi:UDP-glucuronate 4-epimerase